MGDVGVDAVVEACGGSTGSARSDGCSERALPFGPLRGGHVASLEVALAGQGSLELAGAPLPGGRQAVVHGVLQDTQPEVLEVANDSRLPSA
ncbi:MAG: hypothetical protein PIR53_02660 [Nocardioides alkalitolerans]